MNSRSDNTAWRVIDIGVAIAVPVLVAIVSLIGSEIYNHGERLAAIEANRYTAREASADQKILVESVGAIKDALHKIDKQTVETKAAVEVLKSEVGKLRNDTRN